MNDKVSRTVDLVVESILKWTNEDAELAHQVANTLASFDWQQVILEQRQKEIDRQMWAMKNFLQWREDGGGFCDHCAELNYVGGYHHGPRYTKVYSWPHSIPPYDYLPVDATSAKRYCWKCFYKMQLDAEIRQIDAYRREHSDLLGRICWQWTKLMYDCQECGRLFPRGASYKFETGIYCLHCVERAVEQQFILCQSCGKKTASATAGFCFDCYPISRSLGAQVSGHLARAREANTSATLTIKQWAATIAHFGEKCAYCQYRPFQVLEHFIPISRGGGTTADNCVPACQKCNSRKGSIHPDVLSRIFPENIIERIKKYLQNDKQENSPYTGSGRELVVVGRGN